jgi:DNA invertase Pin-like site-specific DNA recombinase
MNIAIYSRVSTKDKGQDVENQLRQLRGFCGKQEWAIVREYVDHASGKRGDREQFQAMFAAASRREFDTVLFWSLDRFSREGVYETLQHLQRLTAYGVGYRSFTEQYLDSCGLFKDAVISILATIAKQERVRLSERTVAGLQRAKLQGRVGGRPRIVCDREKLAELRRSGLSLGQIAAQMNLSKTTVARMVTA